MTAEVESCFFLKQIQTGSLFISLLNPFKFFCRISESTLNAVKDEKHVLLCSFLRQKRTTNVEKGENCPGHGQSGDLAGTL